VTPTIDPVTQSLVAGPIMCCLRRILLAGWSVEIVMAYYFDADSPRCYDV